MELVCFLGKDKENWGQVSGLVNKGSWDKIIFVKNKDAEDFPAENVEVIEINCTKPLIELKNELIEKLRKRVSTFDVGLSIASGSGKEHMAIISALLSIPVGIRLVVFTKQGVEFVN